MTVTASSLSRPRSFLALGLGLAAVAVRFGGRILGPSVPAYLGIA